MAGPKINSRSSVDTKRKVLTVREVAEILGTSERTIREMLAAGRLPGSRRLSVGSRSHWRIPRTAHPYLAEV